MLSVASAAAMCTGPAQPAVSGGALDGQQKSSHQRRPKIAGPSIGCSPKGRAAKPCGTDKAPPWIMVYSDNSLRVQSQNANQITGDRPAAIRAPSAPRRRPCRPTNSACGTRRSACGFRQIAPRRLQPVRRGRGGIRNQRPNFARLALTASIGCLSRTPGPPPFWSIKITPARSKVL